MLERLLLFDVTRLVSRSWTRRRSSGIDRVASAYLAHYRGRAHAVLQHRGINRTLDARNSDRLFDKLSGDTDNFRRSFTTFATQALVSGTRTLTGNGAFYINVSHTDFDLDSHERWVRRCGLRSLYFIHDLIPITHPEVCTPHATHRHFGRVKNALANAAGIIVNSVATAAELRRFSNSQGVVCPPIIAAPLAGAHLGSRRRTHHEGSPYFLAIGTIERRKNYAMLLRIWRTMIDRMGHETPRLIIAGQWGRTGDDVRRMLRKDPVLATHVEVRDRCDDEEVGDLLDHARALLMPTLAEGFGLPIAEALQRGTPVIASDLPALRETGQNIPTCVNPGDANGWARAIIDFVGDGAERQRQLATMASFRPSNWSDHFSRVENWMDHLKASDPDRDRYPDASVYARPAAAYG